MFGRKKHGNDDKLLPQLGNELGIPVKPGPRPSGAAPMTAPSRTPMPSGSRPLSGDAAKPAETAKAAATGETPRTAAPPPLAKREAETRKLIVGREISLSGEITACDRLVVEGSVEANLANCRDVDIADSGLFKGSASIDVAEVRGRFEGTLNVRHRLLIRATGRVIGTVRYGQIEIECGGQISGDIQAHPMSETGETSVTPPRPSIVAATDEAKAG